MTGLTSILADARSDNESERRDAIHQLGHQNSNQAVTRLIHVAKGKGRTFGSGIFGRFNPTSLYDRSDQLAAIKALGYTKSHKAKFFMSDLCTIELTKTEGYYWDYTHADDPMWDPLRRNPVKVLVEFIRAPKNLRPELQLIRDYPPGGTEYLRQETHTSTSVTDVYLPKTELGDVIKEAFNLLRQI